MAEKKHNTSPEYQRAKNEAEVSETAPEHTPERPGEHLSGGEVNNRPTRS
jgi:hypothetical protein